MKVLFCDVCGANTDPSYMRRLSIHVMVHEGLSLVQWQPGVDLCRACANNVDKQLEEAVGAVITSLKKAIEDTITVEVTVGGQVVD